VIYVKAQSKEQNLLVASELEFQDEDWKKVEERTRLYTWAKAPSEEPLTRVCNSAVTLPPPPQKPALRLCSCPPRQESHVVDLF